MPSVVIQRLAMKNLAPVKEQWPGVHEDLQAAQTRINQLTTLLETVCAQLNIDIKKVLGGA